jgi:hypothetical protein
LGHCATWHAVRWEVVTKAGLAVAADRRLHVDTLRKPAHKPIDQIPVTREKAGLGKRLVAVIGDGRCHRGCLMAGRYHGIRRQKA